MCWEWYLELTSGLHMHVHTWASTLTHDHTQAHMYSPPHTGWWRRLPSNRVGFYSLSPVQVKSCVSNVMAGGFPVWPEIFQRMAMRLDSQGSPAMPCIQEILSLESRGLCKGRIYGPSENLLYLSLSMCPVSERKGTAGAGDVLMTKTFPAITVWSLALWDNSV